MSNRLGLRPRPQWGSLQSSPDPLVAGFKGAASRQEGSEGEGREGLGEGAEEGKGGERGKLGIAPWLLGGIDAPGHNTCVKV